MEQTKQEQFIIRRIGGTTYKVRVAFSETAVETMEEKILRMIRNEGVTNDGTCAIMEAPQMSRHYTDDGWSGGNFERPAWKQLVADIEAGKVAHVIVKDMSRAGRDYLQTGFYTEVFFRQHGVHFVAIANGVDSDDQNSNEFAPFLNIMNEW